MQRKKYYSLSIRTKIFLSKFKRILRKKSNKKFVRKKLIFYRYVKHKERIIEYRAKKIREYSRAMIGILIVADQKIAMFNPMFDKELIKRWDKSHGGHGFELLTRTLYFDLIRELSAISFDSYDRSPSIENILRLMKSNDLLEHLKNEYIKPRTKHWPNGTDEYTKKVLEEKNKKLELAEKSDEFHKYYSEVKAGYETLKDSELFKKIKKSRNKLVAHYEMTSAGEKPRMLEPLDIGLNWEDPEKYFEMLKPLIENLVLVISNECYGHDLYRDEHDKVANDFWQSNR